MLRMGVASWETLEECTSSVSSIQQFTSSHFSVSVRLLNGNWPLVILIVS